MKKTLKILSLLWALCLMFNSLASLQIANAISNDDIENQTTSVNLDDFKYQRNDYYGGLEITYYSGKYSEVTIPTEINGKRVVAISKDAFRENVNITKINIPDTIKNIDTYAFSGCKNLESIYAFDGNPYFVAIDGVLYSKDKTQLIYYPEGKKDSSFTIPDNVIIVAESAFYNNKNIESITIPSSVKAIEALAFRGCEKINNIVIPDGITQISSCLFWCCTNLTDITLPDSVTSIEDNAFRCCSNLETIKIPKSVTKLGWQAFCECSKLKNIFLPDTITEIERGTFFECTNLKNVTISEGVKSIGEDAFVRCSNLTQITIPNSVTSIAPYSIGYNNYYVPSDDTDTCEEGALGTKEEKVENLIICCFSDSAGEQYAIDNSFDYIIIGAMGDIAETCSQFILSILEYNTNYNGSATEEKPDDVYVEIPSGTTKEDIFTTLDRNAYHLLDYRNLITIVSPSEKNDICTGSLLSIQNENDTYTANVVVKGDVAGGENNKGDGVIDILDVAMTRAHIIGNAKLEKEEKLAADISGDGEIDIIDVVAMRSAIVSGVKQDIKTKSVTDLDLAFLKLENEKKNKIYSPLSIGTALKMLEEGADGNTKAQISDVLGDYVPTNYKSNKNMSFSNGLFIRDTFEDFVKQSYISTLKNNYDADVILDPFTSPDNINKWIEDKTLGLIKNFFKAPPQGELVLANALGIDMEWKNLFDDVSVNYFGDGKSVKSLEFSAEMNNYDIVKTLGEENVRKIVGDAYREFINENGRNTWGQKMTDPNEIEAEINEYLDNYIDSLNRDYENNGQAYSTDFSLYTDDEVKVFAKDLKEYGGTTLQYIGIMPTAEDLDKFVEKVDSEKLNNIIGNLKELKRENFKDGVVTKITGFTPTFDFEYELEFKKDLKSLGITDVFDECEADLSKLTTTPSYVSDAGHKAKIEFSQKGIKAAAVTVIEIVPTAPALPDFVYYFDVPVEEIDLSFDNPYMFIIRDKDSGDIWFVGTVYEPTLFEFDEEY